MKLSKMRIELRVALLYLIVGGLWIFISDRLLIAYAADVSTFVNVQIYKGWAFVFFSALFIFFLLRHYLLLRDEMESELRESEELHRQLYENSKDAILLTAPDGSILAANPAACQMFGRTELEIKSIGRNGIVDVTDPRLGAALEERARTGSFQGQLTYLRVDGTKFTGEVSASLFVNKDGENRSSMIIRDISERNRIEIALQKSEEYQRALIACSPLALYSIDLDGKVVTWNTSAERIFGWKAAEVIGKPLPIVPHEKQAEFKDLRQRILNGESFTGLELVRQKKGGILFDASLSAAPIYDNNGQVIGIIGAMEDITQRKQDEVKIKKQLDELQRWNTISLEREDRILELKREINRLHVETGKPPRYSSAESTAHE